jgi:hypothetical protein
MKIDQPSQFAPHLPDRYYSSTSLPCHYFISYLEAIILRSVEAALLILLQQVPTLHGQFLQLTRTLPHARELDSFGEVLLAAVLDGGVQQ